MSEELIAEISDIVEEIENGAILGVTMGNMGHDTSEDFNNLVSDFLKKILIEGENNNG